MIKVQTQYAGWALTAIAAVTAAITFPAIADTSASQRDAALWQERAQAVSVEAVEVEFSPLGEKLASFQIGESFKNVFARDAAITKSMLRVSKSDLTHSADMQDQYRCLSEAVYYEARSETKAGQKAVAEVVLNRVASKHYPNTVCGVVYEGAERNTGCQFSFTCDGSMDIGPRGKAWTRSQAVARLALTGGITPLTNKATHYHTTAVSPVWSNTMRMTRRVGSHVFYRFAPRDYVPSTPTIMVAPPS